MYGGEGIYRSANINILRWVGEMKPARARGRAPETVSTSRASHSKVSKAASRMHEDLKVNKFDKIFFLFRQKVKLLISFFSLSFKRPRLIETGKTGGKRNKLEQYVD